MQETFSLSDVTRIEATGVSILDPATPDAKFITVSSANTDVDVYVEDGILYIIGGVQGEEKPQVDTKYNINLKSVSGFSIGEDFPAGSATGKFRMNQNGKPLVQVQYPPTVTLTQGSFAGKCRN
jgi:hypothetical protein